MLNLQKNIKLAEKVNNAKGVIQNSQNELTERIFKVANFNKDGSINKAPDWSVRGHVAELAQQFGFYLNGTAQLANMEKYQISSDKLGINGDKISRNNPLVDISLANLETGEIKNYQAKYCATAEKSMEAATKPKYVEAGVIPLIPGDQSSKYSTIGMYDNGKYIESDPLSLDTLNKVTALARNGYLVNPIEDKVPELYKTAMQHTASNAIASSLQSMFLKVAMDKITNSNEEDFAGYMASFAKTSADNLARSIIGQAVAFDSKNPIKTVTIADGIYDIAKNTYKLANGTMDKSTYLRSSALTVSKTIASIYGPKIVSSIKNVAIPLIKPLAVLAAAGTVIGALADLENSEESKRAQDENYIDEKRKEYIKMIDSALGECESAMVSFYSEFISCVNSMTYSVMNSYANTLDYELSNMANMYENYKTDCMIIFDEIEILLDVVSKNDSNNKYRKFISCKEIYNLIGE